ncbi:MAG: type II toxin-antitoxin system VapC family toxin [Phycisphaerae bacterium]|nr:type II toxin-antitoxin system VapC family toxin [Phycisphaerae bacterium]
MVNLVRVYADTSVFGGVFDDEFARVSSAFFRKVRAGRLLLVTSAVVEDELAAAPSAVRSYFEQMLPWMQRAELTDQAVVLRRAYIAAGIVTRKSAADALHVAIATVTSCPVLVSWNCRHIVHFQKIPMYNAVNRLHGLAELAIHTPQEVVGDEDEGF